LTLLVTGGAGFIGANFILDWLSEAGEPVVNLDKLTYAGNLGNLASLAADARHLLQSDLVNLRRRQSGRRAEFCLIGVPFFAERQVAHADRVARFGQVLVLHIGEQAPIPGNDVFTN